MKIILEHVRSFSKKAEVPIRPLTLLVGENSTGKSTFLAIVSSVLDKARFPANPSFNDPPYSLGAFDTIATFRGGKYGRDETFTIGFSEGIEDSDSYRRVEAEYRGDHGNVVLRKVMARRGIENLEISITESSLDGKLVIRNGDAAQAEPLPFHGEVTQATLVGQRPLAYQIMDAIYTSFKSQGQQEQIDRRVDRVFRALTRLLESPYPTTLSLAPIRSKPRRTYDEPREDFSPDGDHIPSLLARLLKHEADSKDCERVQSALERFGKESGLFKSINVKKLGNKSSDPFQIQVLGPGPPVNLIDVGYGVSQGLPVVVQSVLKASGNVLLMQQPEVHLHPRAQAALGTFLAGLAKRNDRMLLIETHSDYLVDRVRQEVARGTLANDMVSILFFSKPQLDTKVHELTIDAMGNIDGAPEAYRSFFLKEELNLFNLADE